MPSGTEQEFRCPIEPGALPALKPPFSNPAAANAAVADYQACTEPVERSQLAQRLYLRLIPLTTRALRRFCVISKCCPGLCYPEELLGESYLEFRAALDDYDASRGVDFLGYVGLRMHRYLRHRVYTMRNAQQHEVDGTQAELDPDSSLDEEARLLDCLYARELLDRLDPADANLLLLRYAAGFSAGQLAETHGTTAVAMRKRLERIKARLRDELNPAVG